MGRVPGDCRDGRARRVKLYSRNPNDFTKRFPPIAQALGELARPAILDGEIVALDENGHPRFEWLVNRGPQKGTLVYYVFALLMLDGKDVRRWPLAARKTRLEKLLRPHERLRYVDHVESRGLETFAGALALGQERVVGKDGKSPYIEGPRETWPWLKVKNKDYKRKGKVEFHPRKPSVVYGQGS